MIDLVSILVILTNLIRNVLVLIPQVLLPSLLWYVRWSLELLRRFIFLIYDSEGKSLLCTKLFF
jgi:hypothetical protein